MSVLPYGRVSEIGASNNLLALQRPPDAKATPDAPGTKSTPGDAEATKFAEQAARSSTHALATRAEQNSSIFMRQTDTRQIVRQMYRMGSLKHQHAAFDMVFWRHELATQADDLLRVARLEGNLRQLSDPGHRDWFQGYLTLLEARERAGDADDAAPVIKLIDDALDSAWADNEAAILAGFNTAPALMRFAEQIDEWNYFRGVYATLVLNGEALATTFRSLLKRFGASRLRRAVRALRDAIAADLASPMVSADRTRLVECQRDLEGTHTISSMVAESDILLRRVAPEEATPERVMGFVGSVFEFVSFSAYADYKLVELCGMLVPKEQVTEKERAQVRDFLRLHVPLGLWSSLAVRENLFPAVFRSRL
jgi:type III secretion system YopN/LcrE/InvE/MxiC family regulator